MSVIFKLNDCVLIEYERNPEKFIEGGEEVKLKLSEKIFMNFKRKQKILKQKNIVENLELENKCKEFLTECNLKNHFQQFDERDMDRYKQENIKLMNEFYNCSSEFKEFHGENNLETGVITTIDGFKYLIPPRCRFFNKNIKDMKNFLSSTEKFDFIVIDPPWTNRYIKRLKKTTKSQSYQTMSDDDIMDIPIQNYTHETSIVVIWCTNSSAHQNAIEQKFISKWNLKITAKWKWIKIDKCGELFCSCEGSKKPYETIYICSHASAVNPRESILSDAFIFSHPSSIHSHKPPIIGTFKNFFQSATFY
jgi:N6-adenosine-specific RNA methylase IME4